MRVKRLCRFRTSVIQIHGVTVACQHSSTSRKTKYNQEQDTALAKDCYTRPDQKFVDRTDFLSKFGPGGPKSLQNFWSARTKCTRTRTPVTCFLFLVKRHLKSVKLGTNKLKLYYQNCYDTATGRKGPIEAC